MAIEGFDYQGFANDLSSQVVELLPKNFTEFQTNYVKNTVSNFSTLSGEALYNDTDSAFTAEQAMLITQIIAEWAFHKSIDLIHSGIMPEYWDSIMQKIAFTIFEVSKNGIKQNLPQDEILQVVEHQVTKAYNDAIEELTKNGIIDESTKNNAESQSNINVMMEQIQEDKQKATSELEEIQNSNSGVNSNGNINSKIVKLASVALLLQYVSRDKVTTILNKFNPEDAKTVIQYMQMSDLNQKVDRDIAVKCLSEMKMTLPDLSATNPVKILGRLKEVFDKVSREKVEIIVKNERSNVKKFITSAYDDEFEGVTPKIGNIITQYLEESVC